VFHWLSLIIVSRFSLHRPPHASAATAAAAASSSIQIHRGPILSLDWSRRIAIREPRDQQQLAAGQTPQALSFSLFPNLKSGREISADSRELTTAARSPPPPSFLWLTSE
jgi:hypothetical protein